MRRGTTMVRAGVFSGLLACFAALPASAGLPFLADQVDNPELLPLPWGVSLQVYDQRQELALDSLSFSIPGLVVDPANLAIDNGITEVNLKFDAWLTPFLNVFGLVGDLDGSTVVDLRGADLPVPLDSLTIGLDGLVLGGGLTLAYGGDRWFTSLTGVYTKTDLSGDFDSEAESFVAMPRVGIHAPRVAFWVGAMYQKSSETHAGQIEIPFFGPVDFEVDLKENDPWNFLVGGQMAVTKHLSIEIEGGVGDRTSVLGSIGYRF